METISIGKLINEERKRKGMSVEQFCDKLSFQPSNAHKIFKKNNLDLVLLGRISEVLNTDFFKLISETPEILHLHDPETLAYLEEKRAVSQFMEVMPRVLKKMDAIPVVSFGNREMFGENFPIPDFILPDYRIAFSKGKSLREQTEMYSSEDLVIERVYDNKGMEFDAWIDAQKRELLLMDVKLIYRTEEEWFKIMCFVFDYLFPDGFREDKIEEFRKGMTTLSVFNR